MEVFGSVEAILGASVDDLQKKAGLPRETAAMLLSRLSNDIVHQQAKKELVRSAFTERNRSSNSTSRRMIVLDVRRAELPAALRVGLLVLLAEDAKLLERLGALVVGREHPLLAGQLRNCMRRPTPAATASASRESRMRSRTSSEESSSRPQMRSNSVKTFSSFEW